jgi:MFS family permease
MFMLVNIGGGMVSVLLPVFVDEAGGGATVYGTLLAVSAGAGLIGATVAGATGGRVPYGRAIAASQACSGLALLVLAADAQLALAFVGIAVSWFFLGPLTVWAQTLRMRVIPPELRGRVFGLLRTAMQGTVPLGGALAPVVAAGAVSRGFLVAALLIAVPGLVGLVHPALAESPPERAAVLSADR